MKQFNKAFTGTLGVVAGIIVSAFLISFAAGATYVMIVGMQHLLTTG